jgi:hypothetical protein
MPEPLQGIEKTFDPEKLPRLIVQVLCGLYFGF